MALTQRPSIPPQTPLSPLASPLEHSNAPRQKQTIPATISRPFDCAECPALWNRLPHRFAKGLDLLPPAFKPLRHIPFQLILLGTGDPAITRHLEHWAKQFPNHIRLCPDFDEALARNIYAASDFSSCRQNLNRAALAK